MDLLTLMNRTLRCKKKNKKSGQERFPAPPGFCAAFPKTGCLKSRKVDFHELQLPDGRLDAGRSPIRARFCPTLENPEGTNVQTESIKSLATTSETNSYLGEGEYFGLFLKTTQHTEISWLRRLQNGERWKEPLGTAASWKGLFVCSPYSEVGFLWVFLFCFNLAHI